MTNRAAEKRKLILAGAKQVFLRQGYSAVTMKDIIQECGISRGGIYRYFSSVEEIFWEVVRERNRQKTSRIRESIREERSYRELLEEYFELQRERLLHMENSLKPAVYEYFFSRQDAYEREFFAQQFVSPKDRLLEIFQVGVEEGALEEQNLEVLAEHVLFLLEGIASLAMSSGVTGEMLDRQLGYTKNWILQHRGGAP